MNLKTAIRVMNRLAGELFSLNPTKQTVIFLEGPWYFEVHPTMSPDAVVAVVDKHATATVKVKALHHEHINAEWYGPMGARNETYEWRLTNGTD